MRTRMGEFGSYQPEGEKPIVAIVNYRQLAQRPFPILLPDALVE
jgi:hypothetical protein